MLYVKDRKISDMERRIKATTKNMDNLIAAKLFEKGNQLIYQLDSSSRLLLLFKQTMFGLERNIKEKILGEQHQKFKLMKDALDTQIEKLDDYKKHVSQIVGSHFEDEKETMLTYLKRQVEIMWNFDPETSTYVPPTLYPATGNSKYRQPVPAVVVSSNNVTALGGGGGYGGSGPSDGKVLKDLTLEAVGTLPGSVVPEGFQHYSHCSCF